MDEHVFLVAFNVEGSTREAAEAALCEVLPDPQATTITSPVVNWWVAEDDRHDNSDDRSAVFCNYGSKAAASRLLHDNGLTGLVDVVDDPVGQLLARFHGCAPCSRNDHAPPTIDGRCQCCGWKIDGQRRLVVT